jgi:hypothetical protein
MSAVEALRLAQENGIRLGVAGTDLILEADREPALKVLDALRRHKMDIVNLLAESETHGTAMESADLELRTVEWLNRDSCRSSPGWCAWCDRPDKDGHAVVPFGTENHVWLHPECWGEWNRRRRVISDKSSCKGTADQ